MSATYAAESAAAGSTQQTYGQILRSSALVGGSSMVNVGVGIVRTKAMAVLLGPAGVGLIGLYSSIADLTQSLAGLGINSSGVRQIAEAVGSEDENRIAFTATVLRRISVYLGILGAVLLILFSDQISIATFGNGKRAAAVSLLSIAVLCRLVSAGQSALIQGMRRITDLAKMSIIGAVSGAAVTVVIVYIFRERGIVPSLLCVAASTLLSSWWYSRKIEIRIRSVALRDMGQEAAALLKLGIAFMASCLMTTGAAYAVRIVVLRQVGFEATGLYQSAWTLGGLYVGFILQAMGADFYPRLTARARDNTACNRLVNEQARVGLLLAGPGVIATLTFAPLVIALFYSAKFGAAVEVLRWICLGTGLQVVTWPMGFIILAKGRPNVFFWSEFAWTALYVTVAWFCVRSFGLVGAGIAFFVSYVFHVFLIYPIARRISGFYCSPENGRTAALFLAMITIVFAAIHLLPLVWGVGLGTVALATCSWYSIARLAGLIPLDSLPRPLHAVLRPFGALPSE